MSSGNFNGQHDSISLPHHSQRRNVMQFNPCIPGQCTEEGTHCEGCGRTHKEIAETKTMVKALVGFAHKQDYENHEDFANFIGQSVLKKLQDPS
jgi:uncharacterized protein (DUF1684 family)